MNDPAIWRALATVAVFASVTIVFSLSPELPKALIDDGDKGFWFMAGLVGIVSAIWGFRSSMLQ